MTDEVVQYPNRYQMVPVAGKTDQFDFVRVKGTVTAEGDDINKANFLPDALCTLLGIPNTSVPKDALTALKTLCDGNSTLANTKAKIVIGSYTGAGSTVRNITIPYTAKPNVIIVQKRGGSVFGCDASPSGWSRWFLAFNTTTSFGASGAYANAYCTLAWGSTSLVISGDGTYNHNYTGLNDSGAIYDFALIYYA